MKYYEIEYDEFMDIVNSVQYQNQDILEAKEFGYKGVPDAYKKAEHAWARYWVIKHRDNVLTTILEARDGTLTYFTTTDLPGSNLVAYVKVLRKLVDKVTKCREVVFVQVATWYEEARHLLEVVGFTKHKILSYREVWVKEYGK